MALFLMLMGPQGAGKGVQAQQLSAGLGIPHVSTGDLFRAMRQREDALAREVQAVMATGRLVDDALTNEVLRDRLEQKDAQAGAVLDGYPRNLVQAKFLDDYLARRREGLRAVLLLELDLFEAFRRTYGRITAADGRSYNIYSNDVGVEWHFEEHPERAYPPQLHALVCARQCEKSCFAARMTPMPMPSSSALRRSWRRKKSWLPITRSAAY